jgi:NAD(P)-dependent dehydrogenase (short-subunit alcohol dehydrogenase family)
MPGTVFITGAGAGIGAATARLLARDGYTVFAGVRSTVEEASGITQIPLDVTDPDSVAAAARQVAAAASGGVQAIINNAGLIVQGPLELATPADLRRQFAVNTLGPAYVTQAFLPLLRAGGGRVINISAPTALLPVPFLAALSGSKAALTAMSDALRLELAPWNIPVITVIPGATSTQIFAKAEAAAKTSLAACDPDLVALYQARLDAVARASARQRFSPADRVARVIAISVRARSPKRAYSVGTDTRLANVLAAFPAAVRERAITRVLGIAHT